MGNHLDCCGAGDEYSSAPGDGRFDNEKGGKGAPS